MVCHELELPMVWLDPRCILQMVWIKLHALAKVYIPFHLIYSIDNSHSWSCQYIFSSHDYDISDVSVHKTSCFQDDLWLDDTTWLWVLSIPLVVLISIWMDCHLAWCSTIRLQPDQRSYNYTIQDAWLQLVEDHYPKLVYPWIFSTSKGISSAMSVDKFR